MEPEPIADVLRKHTPRLMAIAGVVGTAEGQQDDGTPCIYVLVESRTGALAAQLPDRLGGHPVLIRALGEFEARTGGEN